MLVYPYASLCRCMQYLWMPVEGAVYHEAEVVRHLDMGAGNQTQVWTSNKLPAVSLTPVSAYYKYPFRERIIK